MPGFIKQGPVLNFMSLGTRFRRKSGFFLDGKIKYRPIQPAADEIASYLEVNKEEFVKRALYKGMGDRVPFGCRKE